MKDPYKTGNFDYDMNATPPPNPSDTPLVDQRCREIGKSGVDWHHSATLIADFARTLERRATLAERDAALIGSFCDKIRNNHRIERSEWSRKETEKTKQLVEAERRCGELEEALRKAEDFVKSTPCSWRLVDREDDPGISYTMNCQLPDCPRCQTLTALAPKPEPKGETE